MSDEIRRFDNMINSDENNPAWHGKDKLVKGATLKDVQEQVLTYEPVYFPMFNVCPMTGGRVQADHKAVYRVPNEVFNASCDSEGGFSAEICRQLIAANFDNCHGKVVKLGEVGHSYHPLLNRELVRILTPLAESGLMEVDTALTLFNGLKVVVNFKLTEYEPIPGDVRLGYLVAMNAHDSSIAPGFAFTEIRVVCNNTLRLMMNSKITKRLQIRHSRQVVANYEQLAETVDLVNAQFLVQADHLKDLAKITIQSEEQVRAIVRAVYGNAGTRKGRTEDTLVQAFETAPGNNMAGVRGTGLALHEAFTWFLTHEAGNIKTTQDHRIDSNVINTLNSKLIDTVDRTILAIAG